jgi:phage tail-like protein
MARGFALVRTRDQWVRAAHDGTGIDPDTGGVRLGWTVPPVGGEETPPPAPERAGGLAFDSSCVFYRSDVPGGRVERMLWRALDPFDVPPDQSVPLADLGDVPSAAELQRPADLLGAAPEPPLGDFAPAPPARQSLRTPLGLAIDEDDRLFVCEHGTRRLLVYDPPSRRLLRAVRCPAAPLDIAAHGRTVYAVLDGAPALVRLSARGDPVPVTLPHGPGGRPIRVAISPGGLVYLLYRDGGDAWVVALDDSLPAHHVADALDVEVESEGHLVVARNPGDAFVRLTAEDGTWSEGDPYAARDYDGYGIVRTPDSRIGFWTAHGFREAVLGRVRFAPEGRVSTYRLDGGEFQTEWGRVFLDACIPAGCRVTLHCVTSDEALEDLPALPWLPPQGFDGAVYRPDLTPPLPPAALVPAPGKPGFLPVHRRESGRELAWARPAADDPFETYEAPIKADPGRYLWVTLELSGDTRHSPRVKCLRAERPGHDLLRRLPKTFSRDPDVAAFLRRYLALMEGTIEELLDKAEARDVLLDPDATPEELLSWLASFLGLPLDERWPVPAVRELIAEAGGLLRCRGTKSTLERFVELYLGLDDVTILEHWRLRGLGGALLRDEPSALEAGTVVGENFRVGGALGTEDEQPLGGTVEDAFRTHAHRFTVIVPAQLSDEQRSVIGHMLDVHRPAHTLFELCTIGSGMRVGYGLHVGLLSIIGRTGGWEQLRLGGLLGRDAILGRPEGGMRVGEVPGRVG